MGSSAMAEAKEIHKKLKSDILKNFRNAKVAKDGATIWT